MGLIIALLISAVGAIVCFVISALVETVLTNRADKKTHLKDTENLMESGFTDLEDLEKMRYVIQCMNKKLTLIFVLMVIVFFIVLAVSYISD